MGIFRQTIACGDPEEIQYFYYIAATNCIGIQTYRKLQSHFASPRDLYEASHERLAGTGFLTKNQIGILEDVKRTRDITEEYARMCELGITMIPYESDDYPIRLKEIKDPPPVLFTMGKPLNVSGGCVSVIGARECTGYGMTVAKRLGELLAQRGIAVVSGMARGIDSISQQAAVDAGGYSVALLGGGLDVVYPPESAGLYAKLRTEGTLVCEYVPGTDPKPQNFAMRNRLISGLSDAVCVIEAREKSGTMITVNCALDQGRDVYALPGRITDLTSLGTNDLIRQGAGMITDLNDFVAEMASRFERSGRMAADPENIIIEEKHSFLTEPERNILSHTDENSFTAGQLSESLGVPVYEIMGLCVTLVQKCMLKSLGASRFVATPAGINARNEILAG